MTEINVKISHLSTCVGTNFVRRDKRGRWGRRETPDYLRTDSRGLDGKTRDEALRPDPKRWHQDEAPVRR